MSEREFQPFEVDVARTGAYQYSTGMQYSAATANARLSDMTLESMDWTGLRALDVGCGDGVYTLELYHRGNLRELIGIDLSPAAIAAASAKVAGESVRFSVCSGSRLPFENDSFDVAHLRGVLHHMEDPALAVAEALRVANRVFIIEPNGWNPGLKLIERLSPYHRQHHERSFTSAQIGRWITSSGGTVSWRKWGGFVPFFCPTGIAKWMKKIEPLLESLPILRQATCAVYVVVAQRL